MFGNRLLWAEQSAFYYGDLSREKISSAMEECAGFVLRGSRIKSRLHCGFVLGKVKYCCGYMIFIIISSVYYTSVPFHPVR